MVLLKSSALLMVIAASSHSLYSEDAVNPHNRAIVRFQERVESYVALHRTAEAKLSKLKVGESATDITTHQRLLAAGIMKERRHVRQGSIFSLDISQEIRRLTGIPLQGVDGSRIHKSLKSAEPVSLQAKANSPYPENAPLQSVPPSLLEHLPKVPPEVDYRIVGHDLILRDVAANLIVDYVPNAIP